MKTFIKKNEVKITNFEWGAVGMRCEPVGTGCQTFVIMDVTLDPGGMHNFHKHIDQDEMITVLSGKIIQWVNQEHQILLAGDSVYVSRNTVHASFNEFDEPASLQVVLGAVSGETGYELVDVAADTPWATIR